MDFSMCCVCARMPARTTHTHFSTEIKTDHNFGTATRSLHFGPSSFRSHRLSQTPNVSERVLLGSSRQLRQLHHGNRTKGLHRFSTFNRSSQRSWCCFCARRRHRALATSIGQRQTNGHHRRKRPMRPDHGMPNPLRAPMGITTNLKKR